MKLLRYRYSKQLGERDKRLLNKLLTNFGFSEKSRRLFTEEVETTSV